MDLLRTAGRAGMSRFGMPRPRPSRRRTEDLTASHRTSRDAKRSREAERMRQSGSRSVLTRRKLLQAGLGAAAIGTGAAGVQDLLRPARATAAGVGPQTLVVAQDTS